MSFGKNNSHNNSSGSYNGTQNFTGTDNYTGNTAYNQNGASYQATQATNPTWVSNTAQGLNNGVVGLMGRDPTSFVAGANPLQVTAANTAGNLTGSPWDFNAATDATGAVMNAAAPHTSGVSAAPFIGRYMDPALNDEVNAAMNDFDFNAGQTRAQQALQLAGSGAFGGSGAALTQSATEGQLARARAATDAGLRQQAFTQALGGAQSDAQRLQGAKDLNAQLQGQQLDRTLSGAGQLAGIASGYDANQRANSAAQDQAAAPLQQIQQLIAQAPLQYQGALTQLFSGLPLNLFQGQTQVGANTQAGTQNQAGTENQSGTQTSAGTQTGSSNGTGWGFGFNLGH